MGNSLWWIDWGRENSSLADSWFCVICRHHLKVVGSVIYLFLGYSWRTAVKGNCPRGICLEECTWLFILPRRTNDQSYESRSINGLWPIIWLYGQGLGRNIIRKFITRKTGKETAVSEWTKIVKTFVSFLNVHQGWPQQRMILTIQWTGRSMGTCQSLSSAILVISNKPL